jgi:small subunit ribosomal protein S21
MIVASDLPAPPRRPPQSGDGASATSQPPTPGSFLAPRTQRILERRRDQAERRAAGLQSAVSSGNDTGRMPANVRNYSRYSDAALVVVDGDVDRALRSFKRQCERAGIPKELRRRAAFMGPAESRRLKSKKARVRAAKAAARRPRPDDFGE